YLKDIPSDSRAAKPHGFLKKDAITPERREKIKKLHEIARRRGQSLAQMAIAWVLRHSTVTSALIGASKVEQIDDCVGAINHLEFTDKELKEIERVLAE
ncbi:MAG TPA: L-glyceraldehyde 3-phosphate reductase, partial [Caldithrix abyssi]|nr:L-glyceraldehyde 3-phosphate reductase [Caldithrix abyssi]